MSSSICSEMRLLAQNSLRYRRQILALKHFFTGRRCTVMLLDDLSSEMNDLQLHSIAHGVVTLEQMALDYGAERRRLRVLKMRGGDFRGGYHDFTIKPGGLAIFPRLVAAEHHKPSSADDQHRQPELDALLGGGLERGTSALLIGAAGVGKSSVAMAYAVAAPSGASTRPCSPSMRVWAASMRARRGSAFRSAHVDAGRIRIQQIDPAELSPGEFAHHVRRSVEGMARGWS